MAEMVAVHKVEHPFACRSHGVFVIVVSIYQSKVTHRLQCSHFNSWMGSLGKEHTGNMSSRSGSDQTSGLQTILSDNHEELALSSGGTLVGQTASGDTLVAQTASSGGASSRELDNLIKSRREKLQDLRSESRELERIAKEVIGFFHSETRGSVLLGGLISFMSIGKLLCFGMWIILVLFLCFLLGLVMPFWTALDSLRRLNFAFDNLNTTCEELYRGMGEQNEKLSGTNLTAVQAEKYERLLKSLMGEAKLATLKHFRMHYTAHLDSNGVFGYILYWHPASIRA